MEGQSTITKVSPDLKAGTDASDFEWGAWIQPPKKALIQFGGIFSLTETSQHINFKELLAIKKLILTVPQELKDKTLALSLDNMTALYYARKMGGRKIHLSLLAQEIWELLRKLNCRLLVNFIPGALNTVADYQSRS